MKTAIGYQVESADGNHEIPDQCYSFEIYPKKDVDNWLKNNNADGKWKSVPIYEGDIEEPTFSKL